MVQIIQTATPDPRFPLFTQKDAYAIRTACGGDEVLAAAKLNEAVQLRELDIKRAEADPLRYGYSPQVFTDACDLLETYNELLISGSNRIGKSRLASKIVAAGLADKEKQRWACFHATDTTSVIQQHPLIYQMLPPEWRDLGKQGRSVNVTYTEKGGFTKNRLILPNRSSCLFFNYQQLFDIFEGLELDGIWFDELVPLALLQTMRFRLGKGKPLKIITTFTPKNGFTPTVKDILSGMNITSTKAARLLPNDKRLVKGCPPGHMPYTMEHPSKKKSRAAIFFHHGDNPFQPTEELEGVLEGLRESEVKIRAYGWADRIAGNTFAKYGEANRITRQQFNKIAAKGGSRFLTIDPAEKKPWFMKWTFITPDEEIIEYREWPDSQTYGDWAESHETRVDWKQGPAHSAATGFGYRGYKQIILEAEGARWDEEKQEWDMSKAETIIERWMDPRSGGKEVLSEDEGTSIIFQMEEEQPAKYDLHQGPPMIFNAAPGGGISLGIQDINDAMEWNDNKPLTALNKPGFYIVEDLYQSDTAFREWTSDPRRTDRCALKDPIDCTRYLMRTAPQHLTESDFNTQYQGTGY